MTVVAGDRVKFDLKIFGEPTPEVTWTKEGEDEPLRRWFYQQTVSLTDVIDDYKHVFKFMELKTWKKFIEFYL